MSNCKRVFLPLFGTTHTHFMYAHAHWKGVCFRRIPLLFIIFSRLPARRLHAFSACVLILVLLSCGWARRAVLSSGLRSPRVHPVRSIWAMQRSPESLDFHGFRGFLRSRPSTLFLARCAPSGHEKRAPMRSTPFPDKISENSRPPSRRPSPLSLDIPGFSHVLPSCPAVSRLSQLSCLSTS